MRKEEEPKERHTYKKSSLLPNNQLCGSMDGSMDASIHPLIRYDVGLASDRTARADTSGGSGGGSRRLAYNNNNSRPHNSTSPAPTAPLNV